MAKLNKIRRFLRRLKKKGRKKRPTAGYVGEISSVSFYRTEAQLANFDTPIRSDATFDAVARAMKDRMVQTLGLPPVALQTSSNSANDANSFRISGRRVFSASRSEPWHAVEPITNAPVAYVEPDAIDNGEVTASTEIRTEAIDLGRISSPRRYYVTDLNGRTVAFDTLNNPAPSGQVNVTWEWHNRPAQTHRNVYLGGALGSRAMATIFDDLGDFETTTSIDRDQYWWTTPASQAFPADGALDPAFTYRWSNLELALKLRLLWKCPTCDTEFLKTSPDNCFVHVPERDDADYLLPCGDRINAMAFIAANQEGELCAESF